MKREILILSAILISFSSHADSWESITKSTYQDSAMSKEKRVNNPDGSYLKSVYYIDSAMQLAACEGAKKSAESVFEQMIPLYEDTWPNSKFRLVFDG
ncbi:TPA: attachment protein, partial [Salmonella enterica]